MRPANRQSADNRADPAPGLAHRALTFLADERQRAGTHALINIDTQLAGGLPCPMRRQELFRQQRVFEHHPAIEMDKEQLDLETAIRRQL